MYLGKIYKAKDRAFKVSDMEGAPDTEATINVRLLPPGERKSAMLSGFRTVYASDENGDMVPETSCEHYRVPEDIFMRAVTGWDGFYEDSEGNVPLKFGVQGKKTLLSIVPELADFAAKCHRVLVDESEAEMKKENQNLLRGSSDSGTPKDQAAKHAEK